MPFRRWLALAILLVISVAVTVPLAALYTSVRWEPYIPGVSRRTAILGLLEPLLAYGLVRMRYWGWLVGIWWYPARAVAAIGLPIGLFLADDRTLPLWLPALGIVWLAISFFLWRYRHDFDA